jgi:hypothetical protein
MLTSAASSTSTLPKASRTSEGLRPELVFEGLLARRGRDQVALAKRGGFTGFGYEKFTLLTEVRLLAAAYPAESERMASAVALDPARSAADRKYAIALLGYLAADGRRSADAVLLSLARDQDELIRELSVYRLFPADPQGAYRSAYTDQCRESNRAAFKALSTNLDGSVGELMSELRERNDGPIRGEMRLLADDVRKKLDLLRSPDAESKLEELLKRGGNPDADEWALRAVKVRPPASLKEVLRQRLDRDLEMARKKDARNREEGIQQGEPIPGDFESWYVTHLRTELIPDLSYDHLLLALRESGGSLTELERRRLREFGYEGDPRERLEELLSSSR